MISILEVDENFLSYDFRILNRILAEVFVVSSLITVFRGKSQKKKLICGMVQNTGTTELTRAYQFRIELADLERNQ